MTERNKLEVLKILLIGFILTAMVPSLAYTYIYENGAGDAYKQNENSPRMADFRTSTIEQQIEVAAGYYLLANAEILEFTNLYELSDNGLDYEKGKELISSAISNLRNARETYSVLITQAESTPYYQPVLDGLKGFDYDEFVTQMDLNNEIFKLTVDFLKVGNITGIFKDVHQWMETVDTYLHSIENSLIARQLPLLPDVWSVNSQFAERLLSGQYVSMVFYRLRDLQ